MILSEHSVKLTAADFNRPPERFAYALKEGLAAVYAKQQRGPTINDARVVLWIWFGDEGPTPERPDITLDEYVVQWSKYFSESIAMGNYAVVDFKGPLLKPSEKRK